eukprot:7720203-Pyramimonas_sp.AAC.1
MASPDVEIVEFVDQDGSHHILDMARGEVGEFDIQSFLSDWYNVVFFKVVNVRPEARQRMYVPHVFHSWRGASLPFPPPLPPRRRPPH